MGLDTFNAPVTAPPSSSLATANPFGGSGSNFFNAQQPTTTVASGFGGGPFSTTALTQPQTITSASWSTWLLPPQVYLELLHLVRHHNLRLLLDLELLVNLLLPHLLLVDYLVLAPLLAEEAFSVNQPCLE